MTYHIIAHVDEDCVPIRFYSVRADQYETAIYADADGAQELADELCDPTKSYRDWIVVAVSTDLSTEWR
jgi:hypothetical protein